jgi:hypothetical protein
LPDADEEARNEQDDCGEPKADRSDHGTVPIMRWRPVKSGGLMMRPMMIEYVLQGNPQVPRRHDTSGEVAVGPMFACV